MKKKKSISHAASLYNKAKKNFGPKVYTKSSILTLGKYKGEAISDVIINDAGCLLWYANQGILEFDNDLYNEIVYEAEIQGDNYGET